MIAPYKDAEKILQELSDTAEQEKRKLDAKIAEIYGEPDRQYNQKDGQGAIHRREDGILVLNERYYDMKPVCVSNREMEFLSLIYGKKEGYQRMEPKWFRNTVTFQVSGDYALFSIRSPEWEEKSSLSDTDL